MKEKGVTLVELLVVLAILSILGMISYSSLSSARSQAKITAIKESMVSLLASAEMCALTGDPCKKYSYQGFCDSNDVLKVKETCQKFFDDCQCDCQADSNSWQLNCSSQKGNFNYLCNQEGCQW